MLKELMARRGAELGRIRAILLGCSPVRIPTPPKAAPLLFGEERQLCLQMADTKINNCISERVWQEGNSSPLGFPEVPFASHPEGEAEQLLGPGGQETNTAPPGQGHGPREAGRISWGNPGSRSHKGHRENMLGSFSSALVMVLAMTVSYSIILPKDFQ